MVTIVEHAGSLDQGYFVEVTAIKRNLKTTIFAHIDVEMRFTTTNRIGVDRVKRRWTLPIIIINSL